MTIFEYALTQERIGTAFSGVRSIAVTRDFCVCVRILKFTDKYRSQFSSAVSSIFAVSAHCGELYMYIWLASLVKCALNWHISTKTKAPFKLKRARCQHFAGLHFFAWRQWQTASIITCLNFLAFYQIHYGYVENETPPNLWEAMRADTTKMFKKSAYGLSVHFMVSTKYHCRRWYTHLILTVEVLL